MVSIKGKDEKSFLDALERIVKGKELKEFELRYREAKNSVEIKLKLKGE